MSKNTSRDQAKFNEAQESAAQSLQQVISALDKAKIDLSMYPETRLNLIRQFLGDELADTLKEETEQKEQDGLPLAPPDENGGEGLDMDMGPGDDSFDIPDDVGEEGLDEPVLEPSIDLE